MRQKCKRKKQKEDFNAKNNVGIIILSILLFVSSITLGFFSIMYMNIKNDNNTLKTELSNVKEQILVMDNEYTNNSSELNNKKVELKDKIEEYNIWLGMIEKVK